MKTSEKIYLLLAEANDYVSGEYLAEQLAISRTSVWKSIKSLENQGIEIQSLKHKGYRITKGDLLLPDKISQDLQLPVSYHEKSQSTQIDAKKGIESKLSSPRLYLAPTQLGAKGRLNREFFASQHGGIYMSLHLSPNIPYAQMPPYTMMVASSIVKAISRLTGIDAQIKWVNDIYIGQKKLAGILTEAITSVETGLITDVIIGVGLNFLVTDFPENLKDRATSLFTQEASISRNDLISDIWNLFFTIPVEDHIKVYKEKSLVLNRQVNYMQQGQEIQAKAIDITNQGYLIVQKKDGSLETLHSGEISLSSWTL
ncbi:bifunctional biotin--[acetyl-CoA-carboxylase] ligase/biotin operon repressor BirA [Streptococcus halichoeri]|uniref:bifunctional biotin--[acetyl-CoA-carboxylase] ligase/biotin operon repressor BirA n=1 Tax=Streptococcus halichoeri TaxID=254785 RepID=UPI001357CAD2|nr:bifunctional biotin--[acetyl-CoA-carboxylase] ligase/biotin operon repressor BirA [Streptococcus halichoeri]